MFVTDDDMCMVGTCNMDFRSFYLHFECSVAFYGAGITEKVKDDILTCQRLSHEVTVEETGRTPLHQRLLRAFLKLFAPLM
jgi:cardiolipin synthase